jgi:hypothetical protein
MKVLLNKDILREEMTLAIRKRKSFNKFYNGLVIDYNVSYTEKQVGDLEFVYNEIRFLIGERGNRYGQL